MPLLLPSWLGLAITGKRRSSASTSATSVTRAPRGDGTPFSLKTVLVSCLSKVSAQTYASEPVKGIPRRSKSAG